MTVCFWPNSAVRVSLSGCRAGKVIDFVDRQLTTQSGLRISNLVGELTGSPGQDHATGNSRRDAQYQGPYRPR
jgi:hypothetical protein